MKAPGAALLLQPTTDPPMNDLTRAQALAERLTAQGFNAVGKGHDVIVTFAGLTFVWPAQRSSPGASFASPAPTTAP